MSRRSHKSVIVRTMGALLGLGLLVYLVVRIGPSTLLQQTLAVGWGMLLILALGGFSHLIKAYAWRLTLPSGDGSVTLPRALGLRLISEAAGQLGLAGQVLGEGMRVSLLGSSVPVDAAISSATIDRGLYVVSSAIVGIVGLIGAVMLLPLSNSWKVYSLACCGGLLCFLVLTVIAVLRQWPVLSAVARSLQGVPALRNRLNGTEQTIYSAEQKLHAFHHNSPRAFWTSLALNLCSQVLAIMEVYLLVSFMGSRIGVVSAFVFEGFTKLVNTVGALVPGNVGTYEGGSMLIARLFHITSAVGFSIGICRRIRGLFWAAIGMLCMHLVSRPQRQQNIAYMGV